MARNRRASVALTSGQGVSRRAYQSAYALGGAGAGTGAIGKFAPPDSSLTGEKATQRDYGKQGTRSDSSPVLPGLSFANALYGAPLPSQGHSGVRQSVKLTPSRSKKLK
jgi:hypothetical protein